MLNVGVVGATGYAGEELITVLLGHPQVRITNICAEIDKPQAISEIFPKFKNRLDLICTEPDIKEIVNKSDLVFLALPHTVSMGIAPALLEAGKKVIDLSADYRFKDKEVYEKFYKARHKDKKHLVEAVYGLPELYREKIKNAQLIANPGCYPTVSILALAPVTAFILMDSDSIIIDAKSGFSGAGRKSVEEFLFSEIEGDFKAYKVNTHQHIPEINQQLSKLAGKKLQVTFVPHLLPVCRGILETIYLKRAKGAKAAKAQDLINLYRKFYKKEPFVKIRDEGDFPRLKNVIGTNFCEIGIYEDKEKMIIIAAIDNLLKGASGQAVQNMNIMYKFPEYMGLV
ncbi:MAG: N-acetyl-gamma-glutamyl-phosphate reductase [Candidatus Omnitrophica bacterium]|nr:N-acetyl-gamma-glutamyl-phosphate reductase [Candidatus Omnitrophota bacterium]MBU4472610.1 N-acetyl-gamma-glutamyl-phosphate reductase [Candidatus Omnitrophota bacterium]MCG2706766.1 N-acetyl-gamma-glutamyl-phosphate reductase [Candidatus Omnitrophota bacterium]